MKTAFLIVLLCVIFSVAFAETGIHVLYGEYNPSNCNKIKDVCFKPEVKAAHYDRCWELLQQCYAEK